MVKKTANEKSYFGIREKLETGTLRPGDPLITRQLAEEFGVSLSPVREAINRLASEGLIEHTPGAGAQVKRFNLDDLSELYVLRDAIESCAAGLAADLMREEDREELEHILAQLREIADELTSSQRGSATKSQLSRWLFLEELFHELIVGCSQNTLLVKVIRENRAIAKIFRMHLKAPSLLTPEVAQTTIKRKRKLLAAFKKRDGDAARQIMSEQIQAGRKHVVRLLRREGLR